MSLPDHNKSGFSNLTAFRVFADGHIKFFDSQNDLYDIYDLHAYLMVFSWTLLGLLLISGVRYMIPDWKNGIRIHAISGYIIFVLTFATAIHVFGVREWVIGRRSSDNEVYHDHIGTGKRRFH